MIEIYKLVKGEEHFILQTIEKELIENVLFSLVCDECADTGFYNYSFMEQTNDNLINSLLETDCGKKFILTTSEIEG